MDNSDRGPLAAEVTAEDPQPEATAGNAEPAALPPDYFAQVGDSRTARALDAALEWLVMPLYQAARKLRLTDLLHGTRLLGHPAHPALSDLPVGLYIAAVLTYALGLPQAGIALTIAGVAGALGAAATGLADWSVSYGRDRRLGAVHGTLNVVATLLAGAAIATYFAVSDPMALGFVAGALGVTLLAAFVGGHLVFDRGLMVNRASVAPAQPIGWTTVLREDELAVGQARAVEVADGRSVLLYRSRSGEITSIDGTCTHECGPLGEGEMAGGVVVCPWHQSVFDLRDGRALRGPATRPQPRLLVRVAGGHVQVRDPEEPEE